MVSNFEGYDFQAAATALQAITIERTQNIQENERGSQLSDFTLINHRISSFKYPTCLRLVKFSNEDEEDNIETILRIQGIIVNKELPPIATPSRRMKNFATYAKQAVVLSGFGAILFEEAVRKIAFIHSMFEEQIHGHKINDWEVERFQDNLAISAHSRYFAQKRHVKANDRHSFQPFVDQNGELEKLKGENFVHSSDNVVKYVMRSKKEDGSFQFTPCDPASFQVGDIVEATLSFACFPIRDQRYKTIVSLRALMSLDSSFRETAQLKRIDDAINKKIIFRPLKRKAVYDDEERKKD